MHIGVRRKDVDRGERQSLFLEGTTAENGKGLAHHVLLVWLNRERLGVGGCVGMDEAMKVFDGRRRRRASRNVLTP